MNTPKSSPPRPKSSALPAPRSIRRHSKIARLAPELRERLNLMLHNGASYKSIIHSFARHGCSLNKSNLSHWQAGGFQDWLHQQSWLEDMRLRLDFASSIVKENNSDLLDLASLRIAVVRLYTLLIQFDPSTLSSKLAEKPETYVRVLNALCELTRSSFKLRQENHPPTPTRPPQPTPPNRCTQLQ